MGNTIFGTKNTVGTVLCDKNFPAEWGDIVPDYAFENRLDVVKVELPFRIKKIGRCTFYGCSNLEECVVLPGVEVSRDSFLFCGNVKFKLQHHFQKKKRFFFNNIL